ncbi:MAG: hypothetical protein N3A01_05270 [Bacteroidales bacterium]|nr:hypothetical protein [Bacteroidales bacterium]
MKIAVDFDGTIVENAYPKIGKEKPFAIETLKKLQEKGHLIILWTYRTGKELDEAVEFCREKGLEFYAVNKNYPEEKPEDNLPRKIDADVYIDDKNLGGFIEWGRAWQLLTGDSIEALEQNFRKKNKSFIRKILGI